MDAYLKHVDLDRDAADDLFDILDADESKSIDVTEFVKGCLHLKGLPRSADLLKLSLESRKGNRRTHEMLTVMMEAVQDLQRNAGINARSSVDLGDLFKRPEAPAPPKPKDLDAEDAKLFSTMGLDDSAQPASYTMLAA